MSELLGGQNYVSCSVVLPAMCHLTRVMEVTEDDPAYMIKFKGAFTADLELRKEKTNITWLRVASALDPRLVCHVTFFHLSSLSLCVTYHVSFDITVHLLI